MSGTGSIVDVLMPRLGTRGTEAAIVRWAVAVGRTVRRGELLAEVATGTATAEISAPVAGVIAALLCTAGDAVPAGRAVARIAREGGAAPAERPPASPPPSGWGDPASPSAERAPVRPTVGAPAPLPSGPRRTSPAVRRLARAHGIDLHALSGRGHAGRVTRDDVLAAVAATTIEQRLRHGAGEAAAGATVAEIDLSALESARAEDGPKAAGEGLTLTVLAYVVHAVARALVAFPVLNATVQDAQITYRTDRNVGIAIDTPAGVSVPVIHGADALGLLGVARRIAALSARARRGTLTPEELAGGTFTISGPRGAGNLLGIPIVRRPEVGILRIGAVVKRPVVRTIDGVDAIVVRPIMYAVLSYDHRVIDERTGEGFLFEVARRLEATRPTRA